MNNPLSDIQLVPNAFAFLPKQPGPIQGRYGQVKILPRIGGPYIVQNGDTAAVVDHTNGVISWIKKQG